MSHMWIVESSLAANRSRPDRETPTLVKLALVLGGGRYWWTSWSPLMSQSLTVLSSLQVTKLRPDG